MTVICFHFFCLFSKRKYIIYVIIILLRNKINLNFVLGVCTNISPKLSTFYDGKSHEDFDFSQDDSFALKPVKCSQVSEHIICTTEKLSVHVKVDSVRLLYLSSLFKTNVTLFSSNNPEFVHYVTFKRLVQVQKRLKKIVKINNIHRPIKCTHLLSD